jgi:hypothetical protein
VFIDLKWSGRKEDVVHQEKDEEDKKAKEICYEFSPLKKIQA